MRLQCSPHRQPRLHAFLRNDAPAQHSLQISVTLCAPPFVFMVLQNPFSATHLFSHLYKTPGGVGYRPFPATPFPRSSRDKSEVSSFAATHTENARLSPSAATHTKSPSRKSFPCHTSEKQGGVG